MSHTVTHFGTQATSINSQSAVHFSKYTTAPDEKLAKVVCVIHYDDVVKMQKPIELLKGLESKGTAGLVVLLLDSDRAHGGDKGSVHDQATFTSFTDALTSNMIPYPVYFAFESDELLAWYNLLAKQDSRLDDIVVQVKSQSSRQSLTEQMNVEVFYGVEHTTKPEGKPIIAVSASYDSLSAAPSLPSGMESSVSPVLAVIYMSRTFSRQFTQVRQRFDLMFILTPGASLDYEPSQKFVDYVQSQIKVKIQLVVCLDQLIDSSKGDTGVPPNLYVYDSQRSHQSNIRDAFVYSLKQEVDRSPDVIANLVELGVTPTINSNDSEQKLSYMPLEHLAYASKGLAAITLTVRDPDNGVPTKLMDKFSVLDTDLCLCKLSKVLFLLNEAMAQTIASPELAIEGQFFGSQGMKKSDKMYLKQIMTYLKANSRAPWLIEKGTSLNKELHRIFSENLSKPAQAIAVKIMDKVFVRESDQPFTLRLHQKGTPIVELAIFMAVIGYLYLLYAGVRKCFAESSKVKGT